MWRLTPKSSAQGPPHSITKNRGLFWPGLVEILDPCMVGEEPE